MEFRIQRYQGAEEEEVCSADQQSDIFQARIEERRQKRQKQLASDIHPDQSAVDGTTKPKKKKKKEVSDQEPIISKQSEPMCHGNSLLDDQNSDMNLSKVVQSVNGSKENKISNDIENQLNDKKDSSKKKKKKKRSTLQASNTDTNHDISGMTNESHQNIANDIDNDGVVQSNDPEKEIQCNDDSMDSAHIRPETQSTDEAGHTIIDAKDDEFQGENYFPILGKHNKVKKTIVRLNLPRWLNEPILMSADINTGKVAINQVDFLSENLLNNLALNNIEYLFPVQYWVIQKMMSQNMSVVNKFPPRDFCVQAPTGSGKTLAYVLPIIDVLSKYIVKQLYCLVVVPSKDLAVQVHKVFESYVKGTQLKVALASGLKTFSKEQENLVTKGCNGYSSKVDIVVSTPGRLVDHLKQTPGFNLNYLRFLVVDEADRLLGQDYSSWLNEVKLSVHSPNIYHLNRSKVFPLNVSTFLGCQMPFQKLLFSATLTQNPEKLASLELFHPVLFVSKLDINNEKEEDHDLSLGDSERFIIPENLEEKMVVVDADQKPLVLVFLMLSMNWKGVLCFTNSIAATHRLCLLLQSFQGFTVAEFSSNLSETQRKGIIRDFNSGKVDLLISSDAMARGMDINAVKLVVNYDTAANAKTYVHRVGRTARAGKSGCAITILQSKQVYHFKHMMKKLSGKVLTKLNVPMDIMKSYQEQYENALNSLREQIGLESRNINGGTFSKRI